MLIVIVQVLSQFSQNFLIQEIMRHHHLYLVINVLRESVLSSMNSECNWSLTIQSGDIESMDDEFVEFSRIPYVGNYALRTENWETTYALDVLIGSGLENCGFDMLKTN